MCDVWYVGHQEGAREACGRVQTGPGRLPRPVPLAETGGPGALRIPARARARAQPAGPEPQPSSEGSARTATKAPEHVHGVPAEC